MTDLNCAASLPAHELQPNGQFKSMHLNLNRTRVLLILDELECPDRLPLSAALALCTSTAPSAVCVLVGPEGGWTPTEREAFTLAASRASDDVSVHRVRVTRNVLRCETAAAVAMGALCDALHAR